MFDARVFLFQRVTKKKVVAVGAVVMWATRSVIHMSIAHGATEVFRFRQADAVIDFYG